MRIVLLALLLTACGNDLSAPKIVDGDPLPGNYQNVMRIVKQDSTWCVGTATDDHHLVTSASCVGTAAVAVDNGSMIPVKSVKVYSGYTTAVQYSVDVAVVTTTKPLKASWFASIAKDQTPCGSEVLAVGFGRESNNAAGSRNTGRLVVSGAYQIYDAKQHAMILNGVTAYAGAKDQMVCHGDEGGPIFYRGKLAGVLSIISHHVPYSCEDVTHAHYVSLRGITF